MSVAEHVLRRLERSPRTRSRARSRPGRRRRARRRGRPTAGSRPVSGRGWEGARSGSPRGPSPSRMLVRVAQRDRAGRCRQQRVARAPERRGVLLERRPCRRGSRRRRPAAKALEVGCRPTQRTPAAQSSPRAGSASSSAQAGRGGPAGARAVRGQPGERVRDAAERLHRRERGGPLQRDERVSAVPRRRAPTRPRASRAVASTAGAGRCACRPRGRRGRRAALLDQRRLCVRAEVAACPRGCRSASG